MKRWLPWLVVVIAVCAFVYTARSTSTTLLKDTDTAALLNKIREVKDPMAWFKGDWPLQNHFYRPISTLTFEWDNARYGDDPTGYGRTNAMIAAVCVLLLFWLLRELTDSPWLAGVSTVLFGVWHLGSVQLNFLETALLWLAPLCLLGVFRGGKEKVLPCAVAALGCLYLSSQLQPVAEFSSRIIGWLPGRTASVMTVFALLAMAAFARYVRLSGKRTPMTASIDDVPVSKHAPAPAEPSRFVWLWAVVSVVGVVLALGSYEQAVMLPAAMVGIAVLFAVRGQKSAWWPHVCFWLLIAGYYVLRTQVLPTETSGYQEQQLRHGMGAYIVLGGYLIPGAYVLYSTLSALSTTYFLLITSTFWLPLLTAVGNCTTYWRAWGDKNLRWMILGFLALSIVTFLPMAWVKHFGHYHYWPSAMRAPFVVLMFYLVMKLVASAVSLPSLRAPQRQSPAPGSLLRP